MTDRSLADVAVPSRPLAELPAAAPLPEAAPLPAGTVTFVFSTIEGSARLQDQAPVAYRAALERYHAILRRAIDGHRGVLFETVGDAIYGAFSRSGDAVAAALEAQLALQREAWPEGCAVRARMALHTGDVELHAGHYFGAPLYRCARIMTTAHGGQIVLSSLTAGFIREALPDDAGLRGLGTHRLKDLAAPEELFQLLHPHLQLDFPPPKSLSTLLNNLPVQVTSFVGRELQIGQVKQHLSSSRLVTLSGPGGTGKSRLALQAAAEVLDSFPDGVWLVELAALALPALVPQAIATVLGVREEPGRPILETLLDYLRSRHLLLVLDNCEHLLQSCAAVVDRALGVAPQVHVLATSRQPLGLHVETPYPVPPLSVPSPQRLPRSGPQLLEALAQSEAVRLFADRAAAALPGFRLSERNAPAVAQICHRLDGIPLAIELAAARTDVVTPEQVAARLQDRFRLLTRGSRTALPRQQTLRAVVDWSYDLLGEVEQVVFNRLSVFAGGWELPAAVAICAETEASTGPAPEQAPHVLEQLANKSLVVVDGAVAGGDAGVQRFRLLETLREYGWSRLQERGEAQAIQRRHAAYFRSVAEQAEPEITGRSQAAWLRRLETEHDNLRTALRCSEESGEPETGLRLGGAIYRFWSLRGYFSEGREQLERLLALPLPLDAAERRAARAKALHGAAFLADKQGDWPAVRRLYEESLAIRRDLDDKRGIAAVLNNLAVMAHQVEADYGAARGLYEQSLTLWRELGDRWAIAITISNLGVVARHQSDYAAARELLQEGLAIRRELGDKYTISNSLNNLGELAFAQGEYAEAHALYKESLQILQELGDRRVISLVLDSVAGLVAAQAQPERALRLAGAAAALREQIGASVPPPEQERVDRSLQPAWHALSGSAAAAAWAEGRAMSVDQAVEYALRSA